MNLSQEINNLNFFLITVNFHPTDMEAFDYFYKTIFLPNFVYKCQLYCGTIEFDNTLNRHLHFVLGCTKDIFQEADKLRTKLNAEKIKKVLKIKNTEFEEVGIQVDGLNKPKRNKPDPHFIKSVEVMKSIGYCLKENNQNHLTNLKTDDLESCYQSYIFSCKKSIGMLDNDLEYKLLTIGSLLSYMYDSYKKSEMDITDIPMLEAFMIQHHKLSFIKITDKQKTQALKELELHVTENPNEYKKYKTDTEQYISQSKDIEKEYDGYLNPQAEMIKEIVYLRNKVESLENKI